MEMSPHDPNDPNVLARYLDATNLKLDATDGELCALCDEAAEAGYASVCVYPASVPLCSNILYSAPSAVCTVIGFPHGRSGLEPKREEILRAREHGADEVDIVMHYAALRSGERSLVAEETLQLCQIAHGLGLLTKIIVEACFLDDAQKLDALAMCESAGAGFIKTSTGFGSGGATVADVERFAGHRASGIRIKASGGIRSLADAHALIEAGAQRLGVSAARNLLAEAKGEPTVPTAKNSY